MQLPGLSDRRVAIELGQEHPAKATREQQLGLQQQTQEFFTKTIIFGVSTIAL
jgi:hypothetical protein